MIESSGGKDQQHPLYNRDRPLIDILLAQDATDYNLSELARMRVRYQGFPGARDIQTNLDQVLQRWGLTEAERNLQKSWQKRGAGLELVGCQWSVVSCRL